MNGRSRQICHTESGYQMTDCRKQVFAPQTSVEGGEGGPIIRRHDTCMLQVTCNKLSEIEKGCMNIHRHPSIHIYKRYI